ncbi:hypothetical protein BN159_5511 [Streptomyces davaonensis JCM 4913]|uniref:MmyB-like transcription regulator ligand binding domain-containing protein n=1 Tax=Streptomyces davaonensis (strain DSM 101723 / JCM 4913 / KCC S-0913 / 768) TaxID=1214101 RepID=K4R9Y8_STRDJ|nr:hypothetical protein BN159_5511 [Streptomyces davaonensis JCM 4913]
MRLNTGDRAALKKVLQARRAAIDPVAKGFPRRSGGPGRRAVGLSQEQMDELLARARGTYNRFENGQLVRPAADFLTAVARTLEFSEQEWTFLWQLTRTENPPRTLHDSSGMSLSGMWQGLLDRVSGAIAYVSNAEFDVVAHNEDYRLLFPEGHAPANIMRGLLLDPEIRTGTLRDWPTAWAPAVMPFLKQAVALRPGSTGLAALERDVLADPLAGPLYRASASVPLPHVDGSELPVHHAVHGPGRLATCLAEPIVAPGARINLSFYRSEVRCVGANIRSTAGSTTTEGPGAASAFARSAASVSGVVRTPGTPKDSARAT